MNITIIGAGVVVLAIAYELSKKFSGVFVVEKNSNFGEETSSKSSEVIHSGIYYPHNSLKTELCIQGRRLLYDFCDRNEVIYKKCGKLIIAVEENEIDQLVKLKKQAELNGVENVEMLGDLEVLKLEPNIKALAALHVQ